jgi:microcompartment protein CcmL/EutN
METRDALGIIELASIYKGYAVQDEVLKSANVEKLVARSICSGKYLMIVRGAVADVETAISIAREIGGFSVINLTVIPRVDPRVYPAITGAAMLQLSPGIKVPAMLIIETFSVASAIKAADRAVKEADLDFIRVHVAMAVGGKGVVVMTGDIAPLEASVGPAVEAVKEDGMLAGYVLIRNPHEDVLRDLM